MSKIVECVEAATSATLSDDEGEQVGTTLPVQATPGLVAAGVGAAGGAGIVWVGVQAYEAGRQAG